MLNQAPAHTACGSTPQATPKPRAQASPATRVGESAVQRTRTVLDSTVHVLDSTYWTVRSAHIHTYSHTHTYMRHGGRPFSTARECPSTQELISRNDERVGNLKFQCGLLDFFHSYGVGGQVLLSVSVEFSAGLWSALKVAVRALRAR